MRAAEQSIDTTGNTGAHRRSRKEITMDRFTYIFGLALLRTASPAEAKDKPKPSVLSTYDGKLCVVELSWRLLLSLDGSYPPNNRGAIQRGEQIHGTRQR